MPVEKHETHLLNPPDDYTLLNTIAGEAEAAYLARKEPLAIDSEKCICGGQGRTAADLKSAMDQLVALAIFAVLAAVLVIAVALIRK